MWSGRRIYGLIALIAVVSHASALGAGFVWLDHAHLEEGLALARPGEWGDLFLRGFAGTGFYRPMMAASLSLDAAFGGSALLFHATTLAWHAAAAVLTVIAGEALGLSRRAAGLAGALFAVHPVTALVASAIAFRSEAMIAVALLSLVVFHQRGRVGGAALALFLGALTKETVLVLAPLFVLAIELTRFEEASERTFALDCHCAEQRLWRGRSRSACGLPWPRRGARRTLRSRGRKAWDQARVTR